MSAFSDALLRREASLELHGPASSEPYEALAEELLGTPAGASSLAGISYSVARMPMSWHMSVHARYDEREWHVPAFLARDAFELACAMSMALRMHLPRIHFVIDNRDGFVPADASGEGFYAYVASLRKSMGEDLECSQARQTSQFHFRLCEGRVIVHRMEIAYFETPSLTNSLTCVVAEHAHETMRRVGGDHAAAMDDLMRWLRENVTYADTGDIRDHSAVGMVVNGTAVCQGIAAYASQFLWSCGIPNRYVAGFGRRESHAWNVVRVGDSWEHIDYTFALTDRRAHILPTTERDREDFRGCHTWDEEEYSPSRNDRVAGARQTLDGSIISVIPEAGCYSVNGCVVDTTMTSHLCAVQGGKVRVDVGDLSRLLGGGWAYRNNRKDVLVCFGQLLHMLPASVCDVVGDACYIDADLLPSLGLSVGFGEGDVINISRRT